ncbi:MAG: alpha/beta fold hydrolase [Nitrospirae bacterium]|nr:alpha/beta fold hydrolase [Nitrospirota bacterium]
MSITGPHTSGYPEPVSGDFFIRDFHFTRSEVLQELKIHYRTIGAPVRDKHGEVRNAVLLLHGTGGSGEQFITDHFAGVLFGPGQALDTNRFFIILPDGIGHGQSSKPSNGLHARFPQYTYDDMVSVQHRLLTEHLGINHLRLVLGTSMGGMHAWMWGERYPDFMDALMPLACLPVEIAGRNRMQRRMIMDSIRNDPLWSNGEYETQPRGLVSAVYIEIIEGSSPLRFQKLAPTREAADTLLDELVQARLARTDANDLLYQYNASRNYNPSPGLEKITAHLLAVNSADDEINPPELGIIEKEIRRVRQGSFVLIPVSEETRGHGTHSFPELWKDHLVELLKRSERRE